MVRPDSPPSRFPLLEIQMILTLTLFYFIYFILGAGVVDSEAADPTGMSKMFQDPSLFAKLAANPKTAPLLADPSFMQKVRAGLPSLLYLIKAIGLNDNGATSFE